MYKFQTITRAIDKDSFLKCLHEKGYSPYSIAKEGIVSERLVRLSLAERRGTVSMLYTLAQFLDVTLDELCGPDDSDDWKDFQSRVASDPWGESEHL